MRVLSLMVAGGIVGVVACSSAMRGGSDITSADALIREMHARYAGRWYRTLSFQQDAIRYLPNDSTTKEIWLEGADLPGKLWIDVGPRGQGNGVIYRNDSLYVMRNFAVARSAKGRNALLLLGFDVYMQPPEVTIRMLEEEGFHLSSVREDEWQGRDVYVVGAAAGDLRSRQFWIDKERMLFVRVIQPDNQTPPHITDIRFNKYAPYGGGWVAPEVDFLTDGKRTLLEIYDSVRVNVPSDPRRFDPARWKELR
jgi:hypothetical protein